jgi:dihydroneopterin aldolase
MNARWTVRIERLETSLPVGIYDDERAVQPLWVSLTVSGLARACPERLDECFDYEPLCRWITQAWPGTPHTPLLETRVNELLAFVFGLDHRVDQVWVGLYKQRVSRQAVAVGIERATTRPEFEALQFHRASPHAARHPFSEERDAHAVHIQ